jgi:hypothetical protein
MSRREAYAFSPKIICPAATGFTGMTRYPFPEIDAT